MLKRVGSFMFVLAADVKKIYASLNTAREGLTTAK